MDPVLQAALNNALHELSGPWRCSIRNGKELDEKRIKLVKPIRNDKGTTNMTASRRIETLG